LAAGAVGGAEAGGVDEAAAEEDLTVVTGALAPLPPAASAVDIGTTSGFTGAGCADGGSGAATTIGGGSAYDFGGAATGRNGVTNGLAAGLASAASGAGGVFGAGGGDMGPGAKG
jgi:hypothetical protein